MEIDTVLLSVEELELVACDSLLEEASELVSWESLFEVEDDTLSEEDSDPFIDESLEGKIEDSSFDDEEELADGLHAVRPSKAVTLSKVNFKCFFMISLFSIIDSHHNEHLLHWSTNCSRKDKVRFRKRHSRRDFRNTTPHHFPLPKRKKG